MVHDRRAAIVGIYEHPSRIIPGHSSLQIKAACASRALEDAGLTFRDVDAVYDAGETGRMSGLMIAEYFGVRPKIVDTTALGGSSFEFHAAHAARAIAAGKARVALLTYGSNARSQSRAIGTGGQSSGEEPVSPAGNMEMPWGLPIIGNYALVAQRHMHQYGTSAEQLAEIAVAMRAHALRNPDAVQALEDIGVGAKEIGVDAVVASPMIADPIRLLECCLITDGGGAVVIASADVAADSKNPPVWILGTGEATKYLENDGDITVSAAAISGPSAFAEAGVRPEQVDVAMLYDSFTITVLTALEDLGFCKKGEGGPFIEAGRLRFDRPAGPAVNTDGGGLSSNHPGMRGIFLLIESVRQLRGESTSQVEGACLAVAHGNGGYLGTRHSAATVVLGRD